MKFTATEKILMNHAVDPVEKISPGDIITAYVDYAGLHEGVDARKFELFTSLGEMTGVFDREKVGMFLSHHFCTAHSDELAENQKHTREWAKKVDIPVYDFGTGIAHILIMEQGIAYPGALLVFGDSHTTAYGAVGAMSTQAGIEMPEVFLTGKLWFKVPTSHKYIIEGKKKKGVVLLIGLILLASCASTGKKKAGEVTQAKAGFLEGYYEKLGPGPKDGAKLRWLKPGVDFSKYEKLMIDSVVFFLANESEYKGIDGNEMKELTDAFNLELANALKDKYPMVSEPGPDVIRVRLAITNIKLSKPVLSGVTGIILVGLGISLVKKGATGT